MRWSEGGYQRASAVGTVVPTVVPAHELAALEAAKRKGSTPMDTEVSRDDEAAISAIRDQVVVEQAGGEGRIVSNVLAVSNRVPEACKNVPVRGSKGRFRRQTESHYPPPSQGATYQRPRPPRATTKVMCQ